MTGEARTRARGNNRRKPRRLPRKKGKRRERRRVGRYASSPCFRRQPLPPGRFRSPIDAARQVDDRGWGASSIKCRCRCRRGSAASSLLAIVRTEPVIRKRVADSTAGTTHDRGIDSCQTKHPVVRRSRGRGAETGRELLAEAPVQAGLGARALVSTSPPLERIAATAHLRSGATGHARGQATRTRRPPTAPWGADSSWRSRTSPPLSEHRRRQLKDEPRTA